MKRLPISNQKQWNVNREDPYREFRMKLGIGSVQNIDQLEYVMDDKGFEVKALIELSCAESRILAPESYLARVNETRYREMAVVRYLARQLGVPAYFVMFEPLFTRLFVRDLIEWGEWKPYTPDQWRSVLEKLHAERKE